MRDPTIEEMDSEETLASQAFHDLQEFSLADALEDCASLVLSGAQSRQEEKTIDLFIEALQ